MISGRGKWQSTCREPKDRNDECPMLNFECRKNIILITSNGASNLLGHWSFDIGRSTFITFKTLQKEKASIKRPSALSHLLI
jgi:hypothetical protein